MNIQILALEAENKDLNFHLRQVSGSSRLKLNIIYGIEHLYNPLLPCVLGLLGIHMPALNNLPLFATCYYNREA